ncbi:MAG: hypothetical protein ACXQTI_10650 [Candidatus Nezhaarchaeales archaeon]
MKLRTYIKKEHKDIIDELRLILQERGMTLGDFLVLMAKYITNRISEEDLNKIEELRHYKDLQLASFMKQVEEGKDIEELDPIAKWRSCEYHAYYMRHPSDIPASFGCTYYMKEIDPRTWCVDCKNYKRKGS